MADPIFELLVPYLDTSSTTPSLSDSITSNYIDRLTTLPLSTLTTTEPESLQQTTHSLLRSLQSLSKRSHKSIIESSTHLSTLSNTLPILAQSTASLRDALPKLDSAALHFSETYNHRTANAALDRRKKALLLSRNIDRVSDILDLPTLLSSAISSSATLTTTSSTPSNSTSQTLNYATALDLNGHIRRLQALYPSSALLTSVSHQADAVMRDLTTNIIASLRTPSLKLAPAMRTISWLRRVAPDLTPSIQSEINLHPSIAHHHPTTSTANDAPLAALFLVCRLANLQSMLSALSPLRDLADQETARRRHEEGGSGKTGKWEAGQQTERYLKRYVEIFREQSFAIISMYRSIFPPSHDPAPASAGADKDHALRTRKASLVITGKDGGEENEKEEDPLMALPSPLGTFPSRLVELLMDTLKQYLPNVTEKSGRDSLLTQVLYCAGSLGRLGGDFGGILAMIDTGDEVGRQRRDQRRTKEQVRDKDGQQQRGEDESMEGDAANAIEGESEDDAEEWAEIIKKHRVLAGRLESMVGARDG